MTDTYPRERSLDKALRLPAPEFIGSSILIWVAYVLLGRDIEVTCDEAIKDVGGNEKRFNPFALLNCAVKRQTLQCVRRRLVK